MYEYPNWRGSGNGSKGNHVHLWPENFFIFSISIFFEDKVLEPPYFQIQTFVATS